MKFPCHNVWNRALERWESGPIIGIQYPNPLTGVQMTSPVGIYKGDPVIVKSEIFESLSDAQNSFDIKSQSGMIIYPYGWSEVKSTTTKYKFRFVEISPYS